MAAERRRLLAEINEASSLEEDPNRSSLVVEQARQTYESIRNFSQTGYEEARVALGALGQLVDSLAGLPGRKAVLVVSGGLAQQPGDALFRVWQNKFARFALRIGATSLDGSRQDTAHLFDRLVEHANANRITFYTLSATEDLSGRTAEMAGGDHERVPGGQVSEGLSRTQPLQALATGTGGLAAINSPGLLLEEMRGDLDSYYSLGYLPGHRKDGKSHRLEVRMRDAALAVRARAAYRERTGTESTAGRTLSALLLGEAVNPFGVSLAVEEESRDPKGQYQITLLVKLPMAKLVLLPRGDAHEGEMRIFVGARDTEGRVSEIQEVTLPIKVPNDQVLTVMSQSLATHVSLLLRPGEHRLAVGVRDELGNTDSIATSTYTAGSRSAGAGSPPGPR
jgi:VWFA-related protein